ncbi:MAG TPA: DUF5074 domain-containing protein [Actinomycetota bacterium]|nr:DUF5074 domain-containing protein [Actinomycetota bacterium]
MSHVTTDIHDDDVREFLRDMAAEMPPYGPEPPAAVRRAKRRLVRNGVTSVIVLAAIAAGALGATHLLDSATRKIPVEHPTPGPQGGIATVPVGDGPSAIAFGDGAVWVANADDSTVSRVDPATNEVTATIEVVGGGYLEIAAGEGGIWVASEAGAVRRIDPATNEVVATIPARHPSEIIAGAGAVWVSNYDRGTVTKIDPETNTVVDTIAVSGVDPHGLAIEGGSVWVMNDLKGSIDRIDPATDAVVPAVRGVMAGQLAAGAGSVWAMGPDYTLLRIDPANESVTSIGPVWKASDLYAVDIAATDTAVWVATPDRTMLVDPTTNAIIGTIPQGGSVIATGAGSGWAIGGDNDPELLARLDPSAAVPTNRQAINENPYRGGPPLPETTRDRRYA